MNNRDYIKNIKDIALCLQTMIKTRYGKKVKPIFTSGKYKSVHISFYRSPYVYQFYVEDRVGYYIVYLLKNEKIVKKDLLKKQELIETFYQKIMYFFRITN